MASTAAVSPALLEQAMSIAPVPPEHWLIVAPVLVPLAGGAALIALRHRPGAGRALVGRLSILLLALTLAANIGLFLMVVEKGALTMVMGRWLPPFGIAFTADRLGAAFSLSAAAIALLAAIFTRGEAGTGAPAYGPEPFHLLLLAGVSGAFLTGDIFNLYVWFEVLLIASFGLLALGPDRAELDGALKYGFLNLAGTTLFLVAVGLVYGVTGTLNMADLAMRLPAMEGVPAVTLAALFLFAFSMKAAAFPVQFWLPAAYHTPRASTAALFAALLTKVGVYAMLRVLVMLMPAPLEELSLLIAAIAAATMLFGGLGVLAERDLRRLPGFVLISGIGTMLAGIALHSPGGATGAIFYGLQSMALMLALYLALFEAARLAGTPDLMKGGGLYARHPLFSGLVLALFFAAAGLPPFSGFWPKALIVKAALDIGAWWLAGAVLLSGFFLTVGLARAYMLAFWHPQRPPAPVGRGPQTGQAALSARPQKLALTTILPLAVAALAVIGFGLFPERLLQLSGDAASGLADPAAYVGSVFPGAKP
ncbi:Na+/H+ antiporter subunit D [Gellertiella hungarica]|uniref:Multicomponent Na+:H+ antiporter subunit D n=1 Tax=Gellertiella hungarica TaxID=1572859 RepID=A0A7W6J879_9HYPH|nr:Na+/H+ antiporter subunit D [Gellertiella hungarica]MBB4065762.1 multicomponent Na+:H+ antiporter subunit D [Gellertiella hungarica]